MSDPATMWSCTKAAWLNLSLTSFFFLSAKFLPLKKSVVAERQEAALMTAFNLRTLPALTTYLCLFPAKSIWKGEEASVTHRKSREV